MAESVHEAEIRLRPIGVVRNGVPGPERVRWEDLISEIVIDEGLTEALEGVEGFSHLIVLFWIGRFERETLPPLKVHPESRKELPLVGVDVNRHR